jgi:hypothetical protein
LIRARTLNHSTHSFTLESNMKPKTLVPMLVAVSAALFLVGASAQTAQRDTVQTQDQTRERIYGSELMTEQERTEHRNRLREMKTEQEREQFRKEHHARMQERAKQRGVKLPDEPSAQHSGPGPKAGPGAGAGTREMPRAGGGAGGGGKGR